MRKVVALNSGGFDSAMLVQFLKRDYSNVELHSLYFNYGQANHELTAPCAAENADKYCASHKVVTIPPLEWTNSDFYGDTYAQDTNRYLEARNLIFASYAVSYAQSIGADTIAMALIKDGTEMGYADCTRNFAKKMDRLCREFGLSFKTPFIDIYKQSLFVLAAAFNVEVPFVSCDVPVNGKPCGKCPDCLAIEELKRVRSSMKFEDNTQ